MKKFITVCQVLVIAAVISTLALGSDQIIRYNEAMVGQGHPTLADTLNRGFLIQHNAEGVHTIVPYSTLTGVPTTFPYDNLTGIPTTFPWDNLTGVPSNFVESDNAAITGGTIDNVTLQGVDSAYYDPTSSIQGQIDGKQNITLTLTDVSNGSLANPLVFNNDVYLKFGTDNDFRVYYKAADATFVIALNNGDATCTFSKTGGLTCTGEASFSQYNSTGSDNTYGINLMNTADPTGTYLSAGDFWFNGTDNTPKQRSSDNTVTFTVGILVSVPATASSPCTPGMFADNTSHHMACVATNTWMRVEHATW